MSEQKTTIMREWAALRRSWEGWPAWVRVTVVALTPVVALGPLGVVALLLWWLA